jgi:hypothetical protein
VIGCLSLVLSIIFRLKIKLIENLCNDLSPNVFNKSFVVFDPYPDQRRMLHHSLLFLPLIVGFASLGFALALIILFSAGFMLSFYLILFGLNFIVSDDCFDVYENCRIFIRAAQNRSKFGIGDLKVLQLIKEYVPIASSYYLAVSIAFIIFSVVFPYVFSSAVWLFAQFIGLILQASNVVGVTAWVFAAFLFSIPCVFTQFLASKMKGKIFKYSTELPKLRVSESQDAYASIH